MSRFFAWFLPLWMVISVFTSYGYAESSLERSSTDDFSEELLISPLTSTGHVYLHFLFTVSTPWKSSYAHHNFFPKPVIDILQKHAVNELHVRLTQGVFRHSSWGYPVLSASSGGEVWAWFGESSPGITARWSGLTNSLAGLLCATFNDISTSNSVSPKWSFRPEGLTRPEIASNSSFLRYGMLPRENLCTENLTPWKKLLPCVDRSGLARLLNAIKLLSSHYFSLALDVVPVCNDAGCSEKRLQLTVSVTAVVQPGSVEDTGKLSWSVRDLLESDLDYGCPLASKSLIYVDQMAKNSMVFWPLPSYDLTIGQKSVAVFDLRNATTWVKKREIGGKSSSKLEYGLKNTPHITAHRYSSGFGQQSGGIRCLIENNHATDSVIVSYFEMIPWFLRVYFHSIKVIQNGTTLPIIRQNLVPGRDRLLPHQIELIFTLSPASSAEFRVDFDFTLLKWTEYPPDANHGFEVPPAVISAKLQFCEDFLFSTNFSSFRRTSGDSACFLRLYTEPLLVNLPTPDFSMPYNVICMTCTVLALAFGPVHALTTKGFAPVDLTAKHGKVGAFLAMIKTKMQAIIFRIKQRLRKPRTKAD